LNNEAEKDTDDQIAKLVSTIKTEDEQNEEISKTIKEQMSQEKVEVKKEMNQLQQGQFDSLLSSGQAAVPEAQPQPKEKEVVKTTVVQPKQVVGLTKVAQ